MPRNSFTKVPNGEIEPTKTEKLSQNYKKPNCSAHREPSLSENEEKTPVADTQPSFLGTDINQRNYQEIAIQTDNLPVENGIYFGSTQRIASEDPNFNHYKVSDESMAPINGLFNERGTTHFFEVILSFFNL